MLCASATLRAKRVEEGAAGRGEARMCDDSADADPELIFPNSAFGTGAMQVNKGWSSALHMLEEFSLFNMFLGRTLFFFCVN